MSGTVQGASASRHNGEETEAQRTPANKGDSPSKFGVQRRPIAGAASEHDGRAPRLPSLPPSLELRVPGATGRRGGLRGASLDPFRKNTWAAETRSGLATRGRCGPRKREGAAILPPVWLGLQAEGFSRSLQSSSVETAQFSKQNQPTSFSGLHIPVESTRPIRLHRDDSAAPRRQAAFYQHPPWAAFITFRKMEDHVSGLDTAAPSLSPAPGTTLPCLPSSSPYGNHKDRRAVATPANTFPPSQHAEPWRRRGNGPPGPSEAVKEPKPALEVQSVWCSPRAHSLDAGELGPPFIGAAAAAR